MKLKTMKLKTMKLKTIKQRAYDRAIAHAMTMDRPSVWAGQIDLGHAYDGIDHGTCLYRGAGGDRCLIGAMIPDEDYDAAFETEGVAHSTRSGLIREIVIHALCPRLSDHEVREWAKDGDLASFMADLQNAHDRASNDWLWRLEHMDRSPSSASKNFREDLRNNLIDVGRDHGLRVRADLRPVRWRGALAKLEDATDPWDEED